MTTAIAPREFLADPSVRPMARTRRVDLTAPDVPQLNTEEFIVYENITKKNEVEVIRYIVPFAMERTDIGTPSESFAMLDPQTANGHFIFSPKVNGKTIDNVDLNLNTPRDSTGTLSNADRTIRGGINFVSMDPWIDSQRYNPLFAIPVPSQTEFLVTFAITPLSTVSPIPNPFRIGVGAQRVDFAGVIISGVILPQQLFDKLLHELQSGRFSVAELNNLFDLLQMKMG